MNKREIFSILEIEDTKDEDEIRTAYRTLLQSVKPEEDPEGFKRLRRAYEEALKYAAETELEKEETPITCWLKRVESVYASFSSRINIESWKALLRDPVCVDLDTAEEAKTALFSFLSENYQLPNDIYQLLDSNYFIREHIQEF